MKLRVKASNPPNPPIYSEDQLDKFSNWTGSTDTKTMAQDLKKRGLIGADQLINDSPNPNDPNSVRNSQSDWKISAIQHILANAKRFNIHTPEEVNANKSALISTLNPQYKDALNNSSFQQIHPNWWDIISKSILPEQYAKEAAQNNLATK